MAAEIIRICLPYIFVLSMSLLVHSKLLVNGSNILLEPKSVAEGIEKGNVLSEFYVSGSISHRRLYGMLSDLKTIIEEHSVDNDLRFASIDCNKHKRFCVERNISSYPSLGFFSKSDIIYKEFNSSVDLYTLLRFVKLPYSAITTMCRSGQVLQLSAKSFSSTIFKGMFFIKFYLTNCQHCVALESVWNQLANELKNENILCIAKYNCDEDRSICKDFNIKVVPTLLWFEEGKKVRQYKGDSSVKSLKEFAEEMIAYNGTYKSGRSFSANMDSQLILLVCGFTIISPYTQF
ncbi:hypothetical protein KR215_006993 [Drosophila sulfurigaster]|nr:hypothetical protein KR215_006993 [Drosophila sulfurigaster]